MSQEINLLGAELQKSTRPIASASVAGGALGLALVIGFALYGHLVWQNRKLSAELAALEAQAKTETEKQTKLQAELAQLRKDAVLEAEVQRMEQQLAARRENLEILKSGAIGNSTGFSEHMRGFARQTLDGLWLTGFDIAAAGTEISIEGRATRAELVPAYIRRLMQEPAFSGRSFAALNIEQPKPAAQQGMAGTQAYLSFSLTAREAERRVSRDGNVVAARQQ
jgi:hypothetical protein